MLKLAAEAPLAAIVLEAPYLSTASVAQGIYPYVPVGWLMLDTFRSEAVIGRVRSPLLVLHGERDRVIPFAQGEALYGLANAPKRFLRFPKAGHDDLPAHGSLPEIRRFLAEATQGSVQAAESRTIE